MLVIWAFITILFVGALVLALALARMAALGDRVMSEPEARQAVRPSGGVSMHVEPRP